MRGSPRTPTGKRWQDDTSTGSPWRYVHVADILAIEVEAIAIGARQERERLRAQWALVRDAWTRTSLLGLEPREWPLAIDALLAEQPEETP